MATTPRQFTAKLNQCLDDSGVPSNNPHKRAKALSEILGISTQEAHILLDGNHLPDEKLMNQIAEVFEVDVDWLSNDRQGNRP